MIGALNRKPFALCQTADHCLSDAQDARTLTIRAGSRIPAARADHLPA